jgi:DNA topoisomerase-1
MKLIIVESPTKAKTISSFVPKDTKVLSSFGHIRDLPKSALGIDEKSFEPKYVIPTKARKTVNELKKEVKKADEVILATDEDREGEAIAWHLVSALGLEGKPERIVFHEITKNAIQEALKNPRTIDSKLVDAQQGRRILDRLVGYKLSPFLWKELYRGLSAGRVQSVAVRLIVEREREIQNFKPEEYWTVSALLKKERDETQFESFLFSKNGKTLDKFDLKTEGDAKKILSDLEKKDWIVENVEKKEVQKNPPVPFTTSTLQQDAFRRAGFTAKQTMLMAQQLYEGIELGEGPVGLITYMRTDSLNVSEGALKDAGEFLDETFGSNYAPSAPRRFKTKTKGAQEAHEAIRPTNPKLTPDSIKNFLNRRQLKLYELIWRRFIASQMPQAVFNSKTVDIKAGEYIFRATGQTMKFDGFLKVYPMKFSETELPELTAKEKLELLELKPGQHFTEPPPRYTEASLVKILEKNGIGRPSTYAPIISTIQERNYVQRDDKKRLAPTEVGFTVNDMLVENFPEIVDTQFTAKMEEELDEIASGETPWKNVIREFYEPFAKHLSEKYESVEKQEFQETTDEVCDKCGKPMVIKRGRFGRFMACSGFPDCKNTKPLPPTSLNMKCLKCHEGEIVERQTKRGKMFYGCSRWPECDFATWQKPTGELCPECSSPLVEVKNGIKCSSKSCSYEGRTLKAKEE